jgi:hypothetical protein
MEDMYKQLDGILSTVIESKNLRVMGDWNAVYGDAEYGYTFAEFGLGNWNEKGERQGEF